MQRVKGHERYRRRAVGIRDDSLVHSHVRRVYFRHHHGHVVVHAKSARVIDHHAAGLRGQGGIFPREVAAGANKSDIDPVERVSIKFL